MKQPVPIRALVDFDRYTVDANSKQAVQFVIPTDSLVLTDLNGDKVLYAGMGSCGVVIVEWCCCATV